MKNAVPSVPDGIPARNHVDLRAAGLARPDIPTAAARTRHEPADGRAKHQPTLPTVERAVTGDRHPLPRNGA